MFHVTVPGQSGESSWSVLVARKVVKYLDFVALLAYFDWNGKHNGTTIEEHGGPPIRLTG